MIGTDLEGVDRKPLGDMFDSDRHYPDVVDEKNSLVESFSVISILQDDIG